MENALSRAEILCVGTELLMGDIVNTNAAFLSKRLCALGIGVYRGYSFWLNTALSHRDKQVYKTVGTVYGVKGAAVF